MHSTLIQRFVPLAFRLLVIFSSIFSGFTALKTVSAHSIGELNHAAFQDPTPTYGPCPTNITVDRDLNSGYGSLRQAIMDICSGGTIQFAGDYVIYLNTSLQIDKDMIIDGLGHTIILNGQNNTNIIYSTNSALTLNNLQFIRGKQSGSTSGAITNLGGLVTIQNGTFLSNGRESNTNDTGFGGAIFNSGQMIIRNSNLETNFSHHNVQGLDMGGAIYNVGVLEIESTSFINNTVFSSADGFASGGAIFNDGGTITIRNSHFQGNVATNQSGNTNAQAGAIYNKTGGTLNLIGSTFHANTAAGSGGAIQNDGTLSIKNSTFVFNSAPIGVGGAIHNKGTGNINNSSFSDNYANWGGGVHIALGSLTITNSIIARSIGSDCVITGGNLGTSHHNFFQDGTCFSSLSGDPYIGAALMDLGGATKTIALLPGSRAINAADPATCEFTDQRGVARPQAGSCDIGAFETFGFTLSTTGGDDQSTLVGTAFTDPLLVQVSPIHTGEPVNSGVVTFTGPMSGASINPTTSTAVISAGAASRTVNANGTTGSYMVSANASGVSTPVNFGLTNLAAADLAVTLTDGVSSVDPGQTITYTLVVSNQGPANVVGAKLVDTFPAALSGIIYTATGAGGASGFTTSGSGNINETSLSMPTGSSITYTVSGTLSSTTSGSLTNTATVGIPDDMGDPDLSNNTATDTDTVNPAADLEITMNGSSTVIPGATLNYTIGIKNNGPSDAQNVSITGLYPPGTTFVSFTQTNGPSFTAAGTPSLTATIASLTSGATAEFDLVLNQPDGSGLGWGYMYVINTSSSTLDLVPANNTGSHLITVSERPAVSIEQAPTQLDPTNALPIRLIATFSNAIVPTSFTSADLTISTTAPGALTTLISETAPNDGTVFNISISGLTGPGLVQVSLGEGKVQNPAGLTNLASTSIDNTVYFDQTSPLVTDLSLDSLIIGKGPKTFTVQFNKDVQNPAGNDGEDDVTNPENYLIVTPGLNNTFQTTSCMQGLMGDDAQIIPQSVSYSATDFLATVYLNANLPKGTYRLLVCGSTSIVDLAGNPLNNGSDLQFNFEIQPEAASLPSTGFPMGLVSDLLEQPLDKAYSGTMMELEIPDLHVRTSVVGVPVLDGSWDVSWLGDQAGWLTGSAYPTWNGNTVITGHVWDADNNPGIFWGLKELQFGDKIILRDGSTEYVYQVQKSQLVAPDAINIVMKHEEKDWLTLLTCEKYDLKTKSYPYRRMVRAVLIEVR